jgi:hypothetical protein
MGRRSRVELVYISLIAVAGTLLGSAMTCVLQNRQLDRSTFTATTERLREERITAYSVFLEAMTAFGAQQILRWMARQEQDAESLETTAARVTNHEARAVARNAHYRLMLITDSASVIRSAEALMEATLTDDGRLPTVVWTSGRADVRAPGPGGSVHT